MPPSRLLSALPSKRSRPSFPRSGRGWSANTERVFRSNAVGRVKPGQKPALAHPGVGSEAVDGIHLCLVASAVVLALVRVRVVRVASVLATLIVGTARMVLRWVPRSLFAAFVLRFLLA